MSTATATFASSLFDQLAYYIAQKYTQEQIEQALTKNYSVPSPVASIIAQALLNGGTFKLGGDQSTTLGALLTPFFPTDISLPSEWSHITLNTLSFTYSQTPEQTFTFNGSVTVPLQLANQPVNWTTELTLSSADQPDGTRGAEGKLSSSLEFGGFHFDGEYDFTAADQIFTAELSAGDQISLQALCRAFDVTMPRLWEGVSDISLTGASLELDFTDATDTVQITAQYTVGSLTGAAFVTVTQDPVHGWALAFGGELKTFSDFPVIGSTLGSKVPLDLAAAFVLVSTGAISTLNIPSLKGETSSPFQNYPIHVVAAGIMIAGLLDVSNPTNTCAQNLFNFNNPPSQNTSNDTTILITADLSAAEVSLTADLGTRPLTSQCLLDLTLEIYASGETVGIALNSSITFGTLTFDVGINLTDEQVFGTLTLASSGGIPLPAPLSNLYIDSLTGLLGVDFDKAEATAGFVARFSLGAPPSSGSAPSTDRVKGLLPGYPGATSLPSLSSFQCALIGGIDPFGAVDLDLGLLTVNQISLADICAYLLALTLPGDFVRTLDGISLDNILIYWCDDLPGNFAGLNLNLPDGTALATGFVFQGGLKWGSFQAFADITVDISGDRPNCNGELTTSPIQIGKILSITGDGKAVPGVKPGGPIIEFNTPPTKPYLNANWSVKVLDLDTQTVAVKLTDTEFTFSVHSKNTFASSSFDCQLDPGGKQFKFRCSGKLDAFDVTIYGEKLSLGGSNFKAEIAAEWNPQKADFDVKVGAIFDFEDITFTVPTFSVDVSLGSVDDLVHAIAGQIAAKADDIFKDFIDQMGRLGKAFTIGVHDIVHYFKEFADWFFGEHKKEKPAYFKDYALIRGTADPVYEVYQMKLRWVPNITTLDFLDPKHDKLIVQNMDPVIALLPLDEVMVPSRVNGNVFQDEHGYYISLSDGYYELTSGQKVPNSAKYPVQNAEGFLQRSTVLTQFLDQQVNQEGVPTQSARNDVDNIPTNKLLRSDYAVTSNNQKLKNVLPIRSDDPNNPEVALFIDGIRYVLSDWNTFQYLAQYRNKPPFYGAQQIPAAAYDAIPEYALPDGIRIVPGQLYRSNLESQYTVYWASNDQMFTLCPLTRPYYDQFFPNQPWTEIPDAFLQCLRKGGKDPERPK